MADPGFDALADRVNRSSGRLRIAMIITAALCVLIAAGIASDGEIWHGGWGWRAGGVVGVAFFAAAAGWLGYAALWRQRRHVARLRWILAEDPHRIRSIRLLVARAVPVASWSVDDGSATRGLHVFVADDAGSTWVLPVSRPEAPAVVAALARRCPQALIEPVEPGEPGEPGEP